jgi:hypothetical protein
LDTQDLLTLDFEGGIKTGDRSVEEEGIVLDVQGF